METHWKNHWQIKRTLPIIIKSTPSYRRCVAMTSTLLLVLTLVSTGALVSGQNKSRSMPITTVRLLQEVRLFLVHCPHHILLGCFSATHLLCMRKPLTLGWVGVICACAVLQIDLVYSIECYNTSIQYDSCTSSILVLARNTSACMLEMLQFHVEPFLRHKKKVMKLQIFVAQLLLCLPPSWVQGSNLTK